MRRPSPTTCNSSNRIDRYLGNRRAACHKHLCRYSSAGGILFCCVVFLCMRASVDLTDVVFRASRRYSSWTVNRKRSAGVRAHWRVTATPSGVNGTSQINVADSKPSCSLVGGGATVRDDWLGQGTWAGWRTSAQRSVSSNCWPRRHDDDRPTTDTTIKSGSAGSADARLWHIHSHWSFLPDDPCAMNTQSDTPNYNVYRCV